MKKVSKHIKYVKQLVRDGGPRPGQYDDFSAWLHELRKELLSGTLNEEDLRAIRKAFGDALSLKTTQGFAFLKPHGYVGDFEIIDMFYCKKISDEPHLANWDRYGHMQVGPVSVRKRKKYFHSILRKLDLRAQDGDSRTLHVLNVSSGSARGVAEYFDMYPDTRLFITCLDFNPNAISYARKLCKKHLSRIHFICANVLRFRPLQNFELVWSGGLFDYFDDRRFCLVLRRLMGLLKPQGHLIVGNFSKRNRTRDYMELIIDWHLELRSTEDLYRLALAAGCSAHECEVVEDPSHDILFLHIRPEWGNEDHCSSNYKEADARFPR